VATKLQKQDKKLLEGNEKVQKKEMKLLEGDGV
jgi:hypothetical protein